MSDYVSRKLAMYNIEILCAQHSGLRHEEVRDAVRKLPSADVRENVRGEWIKTVTPAICDCSNCKMRFALGLNYNYCPNCGAKMKDEDNE